MSMILYDFLEAILVCNERAMFIAHLFHCNRDKFNFWIEDKGPLNHGASVGSASRLNMKTFADVLIQEMIKYSVSKKCPHIFGRVLGEENSRLKLNGDSIHIKVYEDQQRTAKIIRKFISNEAVLSELIKCIYEPIDKSKFDIPEDLKKSTIDVSSCAIWVDPLDGTEEFVNGKENKPNSNGIILDGISAVTVLIGVFDIMNGRSLVGVIGRPFNEKNTSTGTWKGKSYWGVNLPDLKVSNISKSILVKKTYQRESFFLSETESPLLLTNLSKRFNVIVARGVGNKILSVIEGNAFGYFLTKPSSYKWDTCAPHAILESVGGTLTDSKGDPIYYNLHDPDDKKKSWCNSRGLIVIRNTENMFKMGLLSSL